MNLKCSGTKLKREKKISFFFNPPVLVLRIKAIFLRHVHLGALKRKHEHLKTIKILNRLLDERQGAKRGGVREAMWRNVLTKD